MTEVTPIARLLNSGSYEEDLYARSLGWNTPGMFLLEKAIVISVNLGIDVNPGSAFLPQYSINARIVGNTTSNPLPEVDIPDWYFPLFPNAIVSLPEIGEQVLIIRENTKADSQGFWIGRFNDTDLVSWKGANSQIGGLGVTPMEQYGMRFEAKNVHNRNPQPTAYANRYYYQIPARLGDVFMQGRNGTYIRHSYNPNYGPTVKPGVLEMGVLQNRLYGNNEEPTLGKTRTKTVHFSNAKLADADLSVVKATQNDDDMTTTMVPNPTGNPNAPPVESHTVNRKNFIVNVANEIYNVSDMPDAGQTLYREVLGEKLNEFLVEENEIMRDTLSLVEVLMNEVVSKLWHEFRHHTHAIPEINIDIPDKEIETKDVVNLGTELVAQPPQTVTIPGHTIQVPAIAGEEVQTSPGSPAINWTAADVRSWHYNQGHEPRTKIEGLGESPEVVIPEEWDQMAMMAADGAGVRVGAVKIQGTSPTTTEAGGAPASSITVAAKTIMVPTPPRLENLGYETVTETHTIDYESISIGGADNPRSTTQYEAGQDGSFTTEFQNGAMKMFTEMEDAFAKITEITEKMDNHLSKRQFIN